MKISVRDLVFTALCIALGVVLPQVLHFSVFGQQAGRILLPMHIPVLLCGFLCGWKYGGICGILVPVLSMLTTGMPPVFPVGIAMCVELCAYGLLAGLLYKKLNRDVYVALIGAMLGGRIVGGVATAILLGFKDYGFSVFATSYFVTALPGIVVQLALIPMLVHVLAKARIIPMPAAARR